MRLLVFYLAGRLFLLNDNTQDFQHQGMESRTTSLEGILVIGKCVTF